MSSPFTEEHQHFRATVRKFCERELAPHAAEWERDELFPDWVFQRAGELGILGAHYPVDVGGAGGDFWFSVAKSEELPRCRMAGVSMGLLVQSDMATPVLHDLGTPEQKAEFLTPALRGQKIAALAVTEPGAGSDVAAIETVAVRDGGDYVITGAKTFITNGTRASFLVLLAKTDPRAGARGCSFFLVPTSTKGFHVDRKLKKIGNHSSDTAELHFEDMRVPERYRLGDENISNAALMMDDAIAYARQRKAFGKPLIQREYWQHKIVDLAAKLEAARALAYRGVQGYNDDKHLADGGVSMETVRLISLAKIFAGDALSEIADQCLQLHGGWGYVEEFPIARAWRDQRLFRIGGGTTETLRYYVAKLMGL
jgi:citronellyl-CoA dehydrogenase